MSSFVAFFFFALTLVVNFAYFFSARTFLLLEDSMRRLPFFFWHMPFFFWQTIQGVISSLSLNETKARASPSPLLKIMCVTHVLYLLLQTFLSFIFFFNSFPPSSLFLVSIFSICFFFFFFFKFFLKKKIFCSSPHLHLPIFFLSVFAAFL